MLFPTVAFAVFFIAAFTMNWLLRPHHLLWRATTIVFSLYFCGWLDLRFVFVVVGSAIVNGALGHAAHRAMPFGEPSDRSRLLVRVAVALDVATLGLFAYHGFLVESVTDTLAGVGLETTGPALGLIVPVGLSVFTLHAISYVVDIGRGEVEPVPFGDLLLYLSFFPHLLAGPVARVDELVPQFHERPDPRRVAATDGLALVGVGLVKAVVVAGYLGTRVVDPAFADPGAAGGLELLVAAWAFAVQIYAALSGVTDIATGCALLLGIEYPRNFDLPYAALSVRQFWERWNITVSHWFHDYVFLALDGGRRGARGARAVVATGALAGLWYGAGWTFVAWGVLHAVYMLAEHALGRRTDAVPHPPAAVGVVLRWLVTFNAVTLAWIVFRADSLGQALEVVGRIATLAPGGAGVVTALALATMAAALAAQIVGAGRGDALRARFSSLDPARQALVLAAALTAIAVLAPDAAVPFGYLPFA